MARLSKTESVYNAILDDPKSTTEQKLEASRLLDGYRKQKGARQRFGKARKLLGIAVRDTKATAASKIVNELPENWRGTEFAREIFPTWPKDKSSAQAGRRDRQEGKLAYRRQDRKAALSRRL